MVFLIRLHLNKYLTSDNKVITNILSILLPFIFILIRLIDDNSYDQSYLSEDNVFYKSHNFVPMMINQYN